ncbi:hypothetical protein Tco_0446013 [Tanacetum coccineum]
MAISHWCLGGMDFYITNTGVLGNHGDRNRVGDMQLGIEVSIHIVMGKLKESWEKLDQMVKDSSSVRVQLKGHGDRKVHVGGRIRDIDYRADQQIKYLRLSRYKSKGYTTLEIKAKKIGGAIGAHGGGIGDSLLVALYACMTFIYGSSWKGEMASEAKRSLDRSFEGSEEVFPGEAGE